jgi:hypothetical protein
VLSYDKTAVEDSHHLQRWSRRPGSARR